MVFRRPRWTDTRDWTRPGSQPGSVITQDGRNRRCRQRVPFQPGWIRIKTQEPGRTGSIYYQISALTRWIPPYIHFIKAPGPVGLGLLAFTIALLSARCLIQAVNSCCCSPVPGRTRALFFIMIIFAWPSAPPSRHVWKLGEGEEEK